MKGRTATISLLAISLLGSFYLLFTPSLGGFTMSTSDALTSQGAPGLEFKLSQISKSPPSVRVTVKNNNPSSTFTILKWDTPLDPSAANLGIFKFVSVETGDELKTDVIKFRRKMPISQDNLQELSPGAEHSTEVAFTQPWMPEKPAKYKVRVEGVFRGVWDKAVGDVSTTELDEYTASPFFDCPFSSKEELLVVE